MDQDLRHLIKEFLTIYQTLDINGDPAARGHILDVQNKMSTILNNDPPLQQKTPEQKPVCKHLNPAIDKGKEGPFAGLCNAVEKTSRKFRWEFGYSSMPGHLYESYAYTEVLGPDGNVYSDELILGFVLLAPQCYYPDHNHPGIEESYIGLSGECIQNNDEFVKPGGFLYNYPGKMHNLKVPAGKPCLLAYAWNAEPEVLRTYSMNFSG